jgi:hypothetical protein
MIHNKNKASAIKSSPSLGIHSVSGLFTQRIIARPGGLSNKTGSARDTIAGISHIASLETGNEISGCRRQVKHAAQTC